MLLNVTTVMNENFTELLAIIAAWLNEPADKMEFRVNQDFLIDAAAAREFRAITMMYQAGILPIEVIYEYFLKADVIPEYVTLEMFTKMLEDAKQFPNNPDFEAREDGFPDARAQRSDELARDLDDNETDRADTELEHDAEQAEASRKSAEKVAKEQPKIPPVPAQAQQAMQKGSTTPPAKPKPAAPAGGNQ